MLIAAPYPCKNGNVRVEIIDYCHGCRDTLNLYEDAFFKIVDLEAGRIKIEYAVIAPQKQLQEPYNSVTLSGDLWPVWIEGGRRGSGGEQSKVG